MKLLHRWQPTKLRTSWYSRNKTNATCIKCGLIENQHHYIVCNDPSYELQFKNEWLWLKKKLRRWRVRDTVTLAMWYGINSYRKDIAEIDLQYDDDMDEKYNHDLRLAFAEQSEIGWKHFLLGRIATSWKPVLAAGINVDEKRSGKIEAAARCLVESLWSLMLKMWKHRNELEHGKHSVYSTQDIKAILSLVDLLYNKYDGNALEDENNLFSVEREVRKMKPVPSIVAWIEMVLAMYVKDDDTGSLESSGSMPDVRTDVCDDSGNEINIRHRAWYVLNRLCVGTMFC